MYGPPPPEFPRATSSPTLILLASGLAGIVGLLFGLFIGMGLDQGSATPSRAPTVTVTVEGTAPPPASTPPPSETSPPGLITPPMQTSPPGQTVPTGTVPTATVPTGTVPTATVPTATVPTGTPPATGLSLSAGRTLVVGRDIQPGTYRTAGPAPGQPACFWARLKSTSPNPADVIAADMPKGPATVTILPTDKGFQTMGCADWTRS